MARILIIDDAYDIRFILSELVLGLGHQPVACDTLEKGLHAAAKDEYDLVLLDLDFPTGNGLDVLPALLGAWYQPVVVIVTGTGTVGAAKIAFENGAWDLIRKPFELESVELCLSRALLFREHRLASQKAVIFKRDAIVGRSPKLLACLDEVAKASRSDANVLITGETGTGKELFALALHENSRRASASFVPVDCAALPENLVESILFGYKKGAFTGADSSEVGLIAQAAGGTLFLDEIGELSAVLQKSLLRVLQERRFRPVGSKKEFESDFRLVAATNKDLGKMAQEGEFRQDLLFRIRTFSIQLPPLRERKEDIEDIAAHHLLRLSRRYGTELKGMSADFTALLKNYDWPGNVRELVAALERAFAASEDTPTLYPHHLPAEMRAHVLYGHPRGAFVSRGSRLSDLAEHAFPPIKTYRSDCDREYLEALLRLAAGNREKAVSLSGLSQTQLYALLKQYGIPGFRKSSPQDPL